MAMVPTSVNSNLRADHVYGSSTLTQVGSCCAEGSILTTSKVRTNPASAGSVLVCSSCPQTIPSNWRAPKHILQNFSICSALLRSSATLRAQLPGTVNGN